MIYGSVVILILKMDSTIIKINWLEKFPDVVPYR
jgi:hypothetical protein